MFELMLERSNHKQIMLTCASISLLIRALATSALSLSARTKIAASNGSMCKLSATNTDDGEHGGRVLCKVGEVVPDELCGINISSPLSLSDVIRSALIPRPLAWVSVDDEQVTLLDGYTAACYTPPTLYFAESALPGAVALKLKESGKCTLSAATLREPESAFQTAAKDGPRAFVFKELGLSPANKRGDYPCAVEASPIHMYCSLAERVDFGDGESMIVLTVETFVVDGSVLSDPSESMKGRSITAKIDAELIRPVVSIGNDRFSPLGEIRSMSRPVQQEDGTWTSTDFQTVVPAARRHQKHETMEWNFRSDGSACPLGFNPVTALIMPRPIGWISTYTAEGRIPHLAPYSFFIDVARGNAPMVAFSAFRSSNGSVKKDAQKDAEETGCFCFNLCSEDMAVAMNLSAAEMKREESEFELAGLSIEKANLVDAPVVRDALVKFECEYDRTCDVASFSIVVGRVKGVSVDRSVLNDEGGVDATKLRLIARLGYMDEYGLFPH